MFLNGNFSYLMNRYLLRKNIYLNLKSSAANKNEGHLASALRRFLSTQPFCILNPGLR